MALVVSFDQLETEMRHFPIVISAIQVERPIFHAGFLKKDSPQLLFDLGIPCNFTTVAAERHRYFDVNTIAEFNAATLEQRAKDAVKAEAIAKEKVDLWENRHYRRLYRCPSEKLVAFDEVDKLGAVAPSVEKVEG